MKNILKYYVRVFMFLFPVFFLPVVIDPFGFGKNWLLGAGAILGLILWVVGLLIQKKNEVKTNKVFFWMFILVIWSLIGLWKLSVGIKVRSLMDPLGLGTMVSILVWMFLWLQITDKNEFKKQFNFLTVSGILMAVFSLVVFLLPGKKLPLIWPKESPLISIGQGWSLAGNLLNEGILILFLGFEWFRRLLKKLRSKKSDASYIREAVLTGFFGLILLLGIYRIFKLGWSVLDMRSAWVIAVESLKIHPIFGVGAGNFIEAFNAFRPASFNMGKLWTSVFTGSSMGILQIWTELGIVGLMLLLWLVSSFLKQKKGYYFATVTLLLVIFLFLPLNIMTWFLLAWVLSNKIFTIKESKLILYVGENKFNAMPFILSGLLVLGIGLGGYWWSRFLVGEIYLRKSLVAASKNLGGLTYDLQIKAIGFNPMLANYRKIYSQTNLALAQNLLSNKDISDEDKQKASTLVQQAVREGKAAITLEERESAYWVNLAVIYKSLVGLVDGSADWSFQAYQQAAAINPVDPLIKLDLGGLLFAANRFDEADRVFEQVVINKPDFANGWYNWAYSAKKSNKLADAVARLQQAVSLVPKDSGDFEKANEELTAWQKELDELNAKNKEQTQGSAPTQPETLKAPEPLPTVGKEEKVNVPAAEMQPPAVEPTITPEVTPTE